MKVGISYAVELEDIPAEVENLLRDVQWDLDGRLQHIIELLRHGDFSSLDGEIKTLKKDVMKLDTRLEDCYSILVGYVNVLNDMAAKARDAEEGDASQALPVQSRPLPPAVEK